jgi:hypothetical protein
MAGKMDWKKIGLAEGDLQNASPRFETFDAKNFHASCVRDLPVIKGMLDSTPNNSGDIYIQCALQCWFYGVLPELAVSSFQILAITVPKYRSEMLGKTNGPDLTGFVVEAAAKTLLLGRAPDRTALREGSKFMLKYLSELPDLKHVTCKYWQFTATFLALLAHDIDLANELVALLPKNTAYPQSYSMLKRMIQSATIREVNGQSYARIEISDVRREFLVYFDAHRDQFPALYLKTAPKEYSPFLGGGGLLGPYCLAWFYLQAFAPEPVEYFSREDMVALLTT